MNNYMLTAGEHTLSITYRENGDKLDKICFSNFVDPSENMGEETKNICEPPGCVNLFDAIGGYALMQNYPNPFNGKTNISFELASGPYVSLKVCDIKGIGLNELAGTQYTQGKHNLEFDFKNLTKGIYLYTIKADKFTTSRKMIVQGK